MYSFSRMIRFGCPHSDLETANFFETGWLNGLKNGRCHMILRVRCTQCIPPSIILKLKPSKYPLLWLNHSNTPWIFCGFKSSFLFLNHLKSLPIFWWFKAPFPSFHPRSRDGAQSSKDPKLHSFKTKITRHRPKDDPIEAVDPLEDRGRIVIWVMGRPLLGFMVTGSKHSGDKKNDL